MHLYSSTKAGFLKDALFNDIPGLLQQRLLAARGYGTSLAERRGWQAEIRHLARLLADPCFPDGLQVALEVFMPLSARRADILLAGSDAAGRPHWVILEFKQWASLQPGLAVQAQDPLVQAAGYVRCLQQWNETVQTRPVSLHAAAWLPACAGQEVDNKDMVFGAGQAGSLKACLLAWLQKPFDESLSDCLDQAACRADPASTKELLWQLDRIGLPGPDRLQRRILSCLEQADRQQTGAVLVITGTAGSGKTSLALRLLASLLEQGKAAFFCPCAVSMQALFARRASGLQPVIRTPGSLRQPGHEAAYCLIADDAQLLSRPDRPLPAADTPILPVLQKKLRSEDLDGMIRLFRHVIFLLDPAQTASLDAACTPDLIRQAAADAPGRQVIDTLPVLDAGHRFAGGPAWPDFVSRLLQPGLAACTSSGLGGYEVRLCRTPRQVCRCLQEKEAAGFDVRLAASACWPSPRSRSQGPIFRVAPGFFARWKNIRETGSLQENGIWLLDWAGSIQGEETDYAGILIGPDLRQEAGKVVTDWRRHSLQDPCLRHFLEPRSLSRDQEREADRLLRGALRILLSRARKGCFLWCADGGLQQELQRQLENTGQICK